MITVNVIQRTFHIRYGSQSATCFTIDFEGKQYIVTARHIFPKTTNPNEETVQILQDKAWKSTVCKVVGFGSNGVDVAVLAPPVQLSRPDLPLEATMDGIAAGQDVFFLGFPFGIVPDTELPGSTFPIPLIKKACLSGLDLPSSGPKRLFLDGHNNPGFSGGPVVFFPIRGEPGRAKVAGIISGYRYDYEAVQMEDSGVFKDTPLVVRYNTGIIFSYSIDHAIDLIKNNPIGFELPK